MIFNLPVDYRGLDAQMRRAVRAQYAHEQGGLCAHCKAPLTEGPATQIARTPVTRHLFPPKFFDWPIHLHHDHVSGLTIGAVHARCNAVLWQHHGE